MVETLERSSAGLFELKYSSGGAKFTNEIALYGRFEGFKVGIIQIDDEFHQIPVNCYALFMFEGSEPIAHLQFMIRENNSSQAICNMGILYSFEDVRFPTVLTRAKNHFINDEYAFRVNEKSRGKKIGSTLWAIGSFFLKNQGIQTIKIYDGSTRHSPTSSSFYSRWGADMESRSGGIKLASTELNSEQKELIKEALGF